MSSGYFGIALPAAARTALPTAGWSASFSATVDGHRRRARRASWLADAAPGGFRQEDEAGSTHGGRRTACRDYLAAVSGGLRLTVGAGAPAVAERTTA